jgi:drug/metabolite transporter (DMT)-like permease
MRFYGTPLRGALFGLTAAALFGASTPVAKLLLPGFSPLSLAGLLYLGAGIGLTAIRVFRRRANVAARREAPLSRHDVGLLAGMIFAGGILGPVLMLIGLRRLSGVGASLLLNLEAPFTILIAITVFREHLGRRHLAAAFLVLLGAGVLSYGPERLRADWVGTLALAAACASWAIDNNLSQRLSLRDPVALAQVKTLGAGLFTFPLALATHQPVPALPAIAAALVLGSLSYGLSIVLNTYAQRILGAARQAAFFSTAPFVGAALAIPLLGERPTWTTGLAGLSMVAGVAMLLGERHSHLHVHEAMEHDHSHVHDEHHRHEHTGPITEPHAHPHRHEPMAHEHPHVSDLHHRHPH